MITNRMEDIDWERDYGLTSRIMEDIKKRVYGRIMEKVRIYEASK